MTRDAEPRKKKRPKKALRPRPEIDEETRAIGRGPLQFDVTLARAHGWSEKSIAKVWEALKAAARPAEAGAFRARRERYNESGEIFIGCLECGSPKRAKGSDLCEMHQSEADTSAARLRKCPRCGALPMRPCVPDGLHTERYERG